MAMRIFLALLLLVAACRDPYDFEPGDPTKPDPPAPPVLVFPPDGHMGDNYSYPQVVSLEWRSLPGATFYQVEVYTDSLLTRLYLSEDRITATRTAPSFGRYGTYYWHVRAASRSWNDYTDWSAPFRFTLPNPAR